MDINRIRELAGIPLMEATKKRKSFTFTKIDYDEFERLGDGSDDYEETSIEGKRVIVAHKNGKVVGLWYPKAKVGSKCMAFDSDDFVYFSELDTNWPYGN